MVTDAAGRAALSVAPSRMDCNNVDHVDERTAGEACAMADRFEVATSRMLSDKR